MSASSRRSFSFAQRIFLLVCNTNNTFMFINMYYKCVLCVYLLEHLYIFSEARYPADEEHHVEPGGEAADAGRVVLPPPYMDRVLK